MTREEALAIIEDALHDLYPHEREALRVLSRPVIELEGWEVVLDDERVQGLDGGVVHEDVCGDRVIVLRRKSTSPRQPGT